MKTQARNKAVEVELQGMPLAQEQALMKLPVLPLSSNDLYSPALRQVLPE